MKKIILLLASVSSLIFMGCEGPEGPQGPQGNDGYSAESEVFELRNVNFSLDANNEYTIYRELNPQILLSDNIIIYRLSGTINSQTPIWQQIPRTLYLSQGELDYDYDFSKIDFTIYAGGNYDIATTPSYLYNQTFRIVIIPGYLSNKSSIDPHDMDYQTLIKTYKIDDRNVKVLH
ncbi:MAG: hypothetical protein JST78_06305 [Bacteroidetes bacterium]|nr:hypothetical protein [Bacteroidota bacterium]